MTYNETIKIIAGQEKMTDEEVFNFTRDQWGLIYTYVIEKHAERKALVCTHADCTESQTRDGEYCNDHYPINE